MWNKMAKDIIIRNDVSNLKASKIQVKDGGNWKPKQLVGMNKYG